MVTPRSRSDIKKMFEDEFTYYWTGAQASVFIDRIMLPDATMIGWREVRADAPLYAYNSEEFDAIVKGVYRVEGKLAINFKTPGELQYIINLARESALSDGASPNNPVFGRSSYFLDDTLELGRPETQGTFMNRAYFDRLKTALDETQVTELKDVMRNYIWGGERKDYSRDNMKISDLLTDKYFNILVLYGNPNNEDYTVETLINCKIIDSQKQIEPDGTPIQEIITFIARTANQPLYGTSKTTYLADMPGIDYYELSPPVLLEYLRDVTRKFYQEQFVNRGENVDSSITVAKYLTAQDSNDTTSPDDATVPDPNTDINKNFLHIITAQEMELPKTFEDSNIEGSTVKSRGSVSYGDYTIYYGKLPRFKQTPIKVLFEETYQDGLEYKPNLAPGMLRFDHKTYQEAKQLKELPGLEIDTTVLPELASGTPLLPEYKFRDAYCHRKERDALSINRDLGQDKYADFDRTEYLSGALDPSIDHARGFDMAYLYPPQLAETGTTEPESAGTTTADATERVSIETKRIKIRSVEDTSNNEYAPLIVDNANWDVAPNTIIPGVNRSDPKVLDSEPESLSVAPMDQLNQIDRLYDEHPFKVRMVYNKDFRSLWFSSDPFGDGAVVIEPSPGNLINSSQLEFIAIPLISEYIYKPKRVTLTDDQNVELFNNPENYHKQLKNIYQSGKQIISQTNSLVGGEYTLEDGSTVNLPLIATRYNTWSKVVKDGNGYYISCLILMPVDQTYNVDWDNLIISGPVGSNRKIDMVFTNSPLINQIHNKLIASGEDKYINCGGIETDPTSTKEFIKHLFMCSNGAFIRFVTDDPITRKYKLLFPLRKDHPAKKLGYTDRIETEIANGESNAKGIIGVAGSALIESEYNPYLSGGWLWSDFGEHYCCNIFGQEESVTFAEIGIMLNSLAKENISDINWTPHTSVTRADTQGAILSIYAKGIPHRVNYHIPLIADLYPNVNTHFDNNPFDIPITFLPLTGRSELEDLVSSPFVPLNDTIEVNSGGYHEIDASNVDICIVHYDTSMSNDNKCLMLLFNPSGTTKGGVPLTTLFASQVTALTGADIYYHYTTYLDNADNQFSEPNILVPPGKNTYALEQNIEALNEMNKDGSNLYISSAKLADLYKNLLPHHDIIYDIDGRHTMITLVVSEEYARRIAGFNRTDDVLTCSYVKDIVFEGGETITNMVLNKPFDNRITDTPKYDYYYLQTIVASNDMGSGEYFTTNLQIAKRVSIFRLSDTSSWPNYLGDLKARFVIQTSEGDNNEVSISPTYVFKVNNNTTKPEAKDYYLGAGNPEDPASVFLRAEYTGIFNTEIMAQQLNENFLMVKRLQIDGLDELIETIWRILNNVVDESAQTSYPNIQIVNETNVKPFRREMPWVKARLKRL